MKTETYIQNSIAEFVKIIYPLAKPVVIIDKSSGGKYKCTAYMSQIAVPTHPLYYSSYCNTELLAMVQVLSYLEDELLQKACEINAIASSMKKFALAEIAKQKLVIKESNRNEKTIKNVLSRLNKMKARANAK